MANVKISDLTAITANNVANNDLVVIVDSSTATNFKMSVSELKTLVSSVEDFSVQGTGQTAGTYTQSTDVPWTITIDPQNMWDGTKLTVPIGGAGWYSVKCSSFLPTASTNLWGRYIDNTLSVYVERINNSQDHHISDLVYLNDGQTLSYRPLGSITIANSTQRGWLTIARVGK